MSKLYQIIELDSKIGKDVRKTSINSDSKPI